MLEVDGIFDFLRTSVRKTNVGAIHVSTSLATDPFLDLGYVFVCEPFTFSRQIFLLPPHQEPLENFRS